MCNACAMHVQCMCNAFAPFDLLPLINVSAFDYENRNTRISTYSQDAVQITLKAGLKITAGQYRTKTTICFEQSSRWSVILTGYVRDFSKS